MKYKPRKCTEKYIKKTISLECNVLVLLLHYLYSIQAWLMDHVDIKNISIFQMEKANTLSNRNSNFT